MLSNMSSHHLAQINIARMIAPLDDPRMADFVALLVPVNALADQAPGFVWRLQSSDGDATSIDYDGDPLTLVNMSVWESIETLKSYVYASQHIGPFRDRTKWFVKMDKPHYCLWWISAGHIPSVAEGRERLEHYQKHGSTPYSFWFQKPFPAEAAEAVAIP